MQKLTTENITDVVIDQMATTTDPRIWITATALILAMAAVGTLIPAIRASRVDPLQALRTGDAEERQRRRRAASGSLEDVGEGPPRHELRATSKSKPDLCRRARAANGILSGGRRVSGLSKGLP